MKIDQRSPGSAGASGLSKSQGTTGVSSNQTKNGAGRASSDTDRVSLSALSERLRESASSGNPDRATHVDRLAAVAQSGNYQVDAMAVSRRIVDEAIRA